MQLSLSLTTFSYGFERKKVSGAQDTPCFLTDDDEISGDEISASRLQRFQADTESFKSGNAVVP